MKSLAIYRLKWHMDYGDLYLSFRLGAVSEIRWSSKSSYGSTYRGRYTCLVEASCTNLGPKYCRQKHEVFRNLKKHYKLLTFSLLQSSCLQTNFLAIWILHYARLKTFGQSTKLFFRISLAHFVHNFFKLYLEVDLQRYVKYNGTE